MNLPIVHVDRPADVGTTVEALVFDHEFHVEIVIARQVHVIIFQQDRSQQVPLPDDFVGHHILYRDQVVVTRF